jgi:hypothetical protein
MFFQNINQTLHKATKAVIGMLEQSSIKGHLIASASSIWTFCVVKLLINIFSILIINEEQFTKLLKISMQAAVYFCYLKD